MKAILSKLAVVVLAVGGTVGTVQAESGSDYLMDFRLKQLELAAQRAERDSGQRFAQLVEEQPTAAGPMNEIQSQAIEERDPVYLSPIHQDRALYGSPK